MLNKEEINKTLNRLKNHPEMLETIKELLDISEGIKGIEKADDAEFALIPKVRGLGKKCLHDWAKQQSEAGKEEAKMEKLRSHAIETALEKEKTILKAAFKDAENDPDLKETMDDWAALDGEDWDA